MKKYAALFSFVAVAVVAAIVNVTTPNDQPAKALADDPPPKNAENETLKPAFMIDPRVVLVSVDGLRSELVNDRDMPWLSRLREKAAWTLEAQTPLPAVTNVSHAVMFTGASPVTNGVVDNHVPAGRERSKWWPVQTETVFQVLRKEKRLSAAHVQKPKILHLLAHCPQAQEIGHDICGPTYTLNEPNDRMFVGDACQRLMDEGTDMEPATDLVFLHLKDVDFAGHDYGWLSSWQRTVAKRVDGMLSEMHRCAEQSSEAEARPYILIVTADHGGHGKTHGADRPSDRNVPWIAIGAGIKPGKIETEVGLVDTAPTVLKILGIDPATALPEATGRVLTEILE